MRKSMAVKMFFVLVLIGVCGLQAMSQEASDEVVFNWYDDTGGFSSDNIFALCPLGASSATITLGTSSQSVGLSQYNDTLVSFSGMKGGPVLITAPYCPAIVASQRTLYNNGFNEVYAQSPIFADTQLMLNWYDNQTSGFTDYIQLANPNPGSAAFVTVTIGTNVKQTTVPANGAGYVNFPGVKGGPVMISSSVPILASARTEYNNSFNEVNAIPVGINNRSSTELVMNWYDNTSADGFSHDNIFLGNPGTTSASVTVTIPGCTQSAVVAPKTVSIVSCGSIKGGPVLISSTQPIIASQRVFYGSSNSDAYAVPYGSASSSNVLLWYDQLTSGFAHDEIHIYNEGGAGTVTVQFQTDTCNPPSSGCQALSFTAGQEQYTSFPGMKGGPVFITASNGAGPLIVSARTEANGSFNEVYAPSTENVFSIISNKSGSLVASAQTEANSIANKVYVSSSNDVPVGHKR